MAKPARMHEYTYADYLDLERHSEIKHEFVRGEIHAMTGGSARHALLGANVVFALKRRLGGGRCRVFNSELRVRCVAVEVTTYPDASVVCGELEFDPDSPHGIVNPTVVVEVTSPSSSAYDRGEKSSFYRSIQALKAIVIVDHERRVVEVHERFADEWTTRRAEAGGHVVVEALGIELEVDEIYAGAD